MKNKRDQPACAMCKHCLEVGTHDSGSFYYCEVESIRPFFDPYIDGTTSTEEERDELFTWDIAYEVKPWHICDLYQEGERRIQ